jgi:hypothetical protein
VFNTTTRSSDTLDILAIASSVSRARHGVVAMPPSAIHASFTEAIGEVEGDRGGRQWEFVGLPIANFQVERAADPCCHRQPEANDQLAGGKVRLDVRRVARQSVQLGEGDGGAYRPARQYRQLRPPYPAEAVTT